MWILSGDGLRFLPLSCSQMVVALPVFPMTTVLKDEFVHTFD